MSSGRPSTFQPTTSATASSTSSSTSSALQTRIALKRAELANLQSLRDLSATLATQMSTLEQKLATLRDGTEAVSCVLANWEGVLGVIGLVGSNLKNLEGQGREEGLPETLVRIPVRKEEEKAETGAVGDK